MVRREKLQKSFIKSDHTAPPGGRVTRCGFLSVDSTIQKTSVSSRFAPSRTIPIVSPGNSGSWRPVQGLSDENPPNSRTTHVSFSVVRLSPSLVRTLLSSSQLGEKIVQHRDVVIRSRRLCVLTVLSERVDNSVELHRGRRIEHARLGRFADRFVE